MSNNRRNTWNLEELTWEHVKQSKYEVAILPFGATEPHNLHLPYGTDIFESRIIGNMLCERATALGAKVVLLPTIPFGTETNQKNFPLSINLNPSTLALVIQDVIDSLLPHGIKKIVLLNSHGGNEFKPLLRELYGKSEAKLFLCDWFRLVKDVYSDIFEHAEDHAGEMETSIGLAYFPDLIGKNDDGTLRADEGATSKTRFKAVNEGWVSITRPWHLLTTNSGSGNPHSATADKGRQVVDVVVERVAPFLKELSDSEVDERFPF